MLSLCVSHSFAVSSAIMPPTRTKNSLESSVPPVSSAPVSTVLVTTTVLSTSVQGSDTPASASFRLDF